MKDEGRVSEDSKITNGYPHNVLLLLVWKSNLSKAKTEIQQNYFYKNLGSLQNIWMDVVVEHKRNLDQMVIKIKVIDQEYKIGNLNSC